MKKSKPTLRCPYCDKVCRTAPGVERHIAQKPTCLAQRLKEHNPRSEVGAGTPLATEPDPTPTVLPDADDRMELESQPDNQPGSNTHSPRRMPSVTLEEVPDDDAPKMRSPCHTPSVTLEEVEDEEMPNPPHWGPQPFAKRTRRHLFCEPHPDPTAGVPLRFIPTDRTIPPLYTSKLAEPDNFQEAYWLDNSSLTLSHEEKYFNLPRTKNWLWHSVNELDTEIYQLPRGPRWYCETKIVEGDRGVEVLDLWKREIGEMVEWILRN
ncbi:hypothetical protein FRC08_017838 [Ceratobasidium sp. 394]|nr:hypothetical protein FRC08_017838 [Ceratobasidium sp. 394]